MRNGANDRAVASIDALRVSALCRDSADTTLALLLALDTERSVQG